MKRRRTEGEEGGGLKRMKSTERVCGCVSVFVLTSLEKVNNESVACH